MSDTDRLAKQRETLVGALNDARPSPDWAWEVLNTWDALVEIAKAARELHDEGIDGITESGHNMVGIEYVIALGNALERLDSGLPAEPGEGQ